MDAESLEIMPNVIWYYGKTGTGKSHKLFEGYNPDTHYLLNENDIRFWRGYNNQNIILINGFSGEMRYDKLLNLCLNPHKIIIASCKRPEDIYKHDIQQFLKHCKIIELKNVYSIINY